MQRRKKIDIDKLAYEKEMLALGAEYIAGADEVGRGPLAGPVVCAAVIMPLGEGERTHRVHRRQQKVETRGAGAAGGAHPRARHRL